MEKPILFSGEMVRAILDGRKTQTRRVVKPQPEKCNDGWIYNNLHFADDAQMQSHLFHDVYGHDKCPYGGVYSDGTGDLLWVRETFGVITQPLTGEKSAIYKVTHKPEFPNEQLGFDGSKWRPSIFMPRWASRITLRVVDVRVEMLQQIEPEDCKAEGVYNAGSLASNTMYREAFATLWDSINAKRGYTWDSNPWVWVVEFEEVKP